MFGQNSSHFDGRGTLITPNQPPVRTAESAGVPRLGN